MDINQENDAVIKSKEDLSNFTSIYDAYVTDVYRYVYSRLQNKTEAEDITSETFLKALEKIATYTPQEGKTIKCWLFTIARNLMYDKYRRTG
jgi:RNA polymerase sigma-70 factor (ECF subfamily)